MQLASYLLLLFMVASTSVVAFSFENIGTLENTVQHADAKNTSEQLSVATADEQLNRLADIRVNTVEELHTLLARVDKLMSQSLPESGSISPVVFLLHGEEARTFFLQNYTQYKSTVDLAAKLSAFNVVDIKVCERWASNKKLDVRRLQPFVGTVPFAPVEEKRLVEKEGYRYF